MRVWIRVRGVLGMHFLRVSFSTYQFSSVVDMTVCWILRTKRNSKIKSFGTAVLHMSVSIISLRVLRKSHGPAAALTFSKCLSAQSICCKSRIDNCVPSYEHSDDVFGDRFFAQIFCCSRAVDKETDTHAQYHESPCVL